MNKFYNVIGNKAGKIFLWFLSLILLLTIISQLSLWAGIRWLNTNNGSNWVESQINVGLQNSDYKLRMEGFHYRPLTSLKLSKLTLLDAEGSLAEIQDAQLSIDILSLPVKTLSISLDAKKAELLRLPQSEKEQKTKFKAEPIDLPDIYFKKISISDIKIDNFEISETIAGQKLNFSPALSGALKLSKQQVSLNLKLKPDVENINTLTGLPQIITMKADYNSQDLLLNLEKVTIQSDLYKVSSSGDASLKENGEVNFSAKIESDDLSRFNSDISGSFKSSALLSGSIDALKLKADGELALNKLKENNLTPIIFHAQTDLSTDTKGVLPAILLTLSSTYQELPITLKAQLIKKDGVISIEEIDGKAPDIDVSGAVNYNMDTSLADGQVDIEIAKLDAYKKLISQDIDAIGSMKATLSNVNNLQKIETQSQFKSIKFQDIKIGSFNLKTATNDIQKIRSTQILANIDNLQSNAIIFTNTTAEISENKDNSFAFKINSKGNYQKPFTFKATSNLYNLDKPETPLSAKSINASLNIDKGTLNATGEINKETIDLKLTTADFSLQNLPVPLPLALRKMIISGKATASGAMNDPIIDFSANINPTKIYKGAPDISFSLAGNYKDGLAWVSLNGEGQNIQTLKGNVETPIEISFSPFSFSLTDNQPLKGNLDVAADTKYLLDQFLPPQYDLSGQLTSNMIIGGTLNNPQLSGKADLQDGSFIDQNLGIKLNGLFLSCLFTPEEISLKRLSAKDDKDGLISAKGLISLNNYRLENADLNLMLENFHLLQNDIADGVFNADINLKGTPNQYNLIGTIKSDYIDITIPEKNSQRIPELNIVEKGEEDKTQNLLNKIAINIQYIADNRIFVRGWGLDAEFGGKITVKGDLENPKFNGQLQSNRGRYEEFGKRFKLTKANLNFLGTIPPYPNLDIVAETKSDDITAQVNLTGSISDPKIGFSSIPSLPDDEILSHILFGENLSKISPFQAIELARTIRRFSGEGGGGFDPLNNLREATGFDDLRVETDEEGQANVGVGKYLTDKVYLEFEKGTGENSGAANLQVEVTPNVTVESEIGQDTQAGASVFWEWDY